MIGRADIEGSKSNVAMNAWLPQASYSLSQGSVGNPSRSVTSRLSGQRVKLERVLDIRHVSDIYIITFVVHGRHQEPHA